MNEKRKNNIPVFEHFALHLNLSLHLLVQLHRGTLQWSIL